MTLQLRKNNIPNKYFYYPDINFVIANFAGIPIHFSVVFLYPENKKDYMKKIYRSLRTSIRASIYNTPLLGRTIVVLSFFCLLIKQILIYLTFKEVFQEATLWATMSHYLWFFVSDFLVCLILLWLVAINTLIKKTAIKIINIIIISGIFLLFVLDIVTMYFFQSRLSILDMNQFIGSSLGDFSWMIVSVSAIVCILWIIAFFVVQSGKFRKNKRVLLAIYFLLFAIACFGVGIYAPGWFNSIPQNIVSINYSAFFQNFRTVSTTSTSSGYKKFFIKKKWLHQQPNVIIIFAESLSPIDSLRNGKVNDNLPYFDLIQKQGITFTNFINNGCTSDTAHIGLLLGIEPIKPLWSQVSAYSGYVGYADPLPVFFSKQGYTPIFVSAVNLEFLDQKAFLSGAGFTHIFGEENFTGEKKYVFDAAPDYALYNKTLETIKEQSKPYLLALQTISFHKPYFTPYGNTQKDALRYADKSLYYFYLQLKKSWFFDNGILVIVGDHRKMEPLEAWEKEALGNFRYTKWLATIVGKGIEPWTVNTNIIQHTDIFYWLEQLVGKWSVTVSRLFNDVFTSNKKRDRGLVYCRYFQNNNKYTLVTWTGATGKMFNDISEISTSHAFIYQYISSYISFEQWSGAKLSGTGKSNMIIIAHQWSPLQLPENSISWFLLAKENGADGVEFDVSQTKDKQNVVIHGDRLRATTCGKDYIIGTHTLQDLDKNCPLKNGQPLMTLEDNLKAIKGLFDYYFIDVKVYTTGDAEKETTAIIQTVQKLGMQDKAIITSYDKAATYVLWSYKNIHAWRDTYNLTDLDALPNMHHEYYMMPWELIKPTTPQEADDIGKKLVIYTVNTTGELEKLYKQWVRMIMTDDVPLIKWRADNYLTQ